MNSGDWQSMESAPKDGTRILVYGRGQERATLPATSSWVAPLRTYRKVESLREGAIKPTRFSRGM